MRTDSRDFEILTIGLDGGWGGAGNNPRILDMRTGNIHAPRRIQNWTEVVEKASNVLHALIDFWIDKGVGIFPIYIRNGRKFPRAHLSRADQRGIDQRDQVRGSMGVGAPSLRGELDKQREPEIDLMALRNFDLENVLTTNTIPIVGCE